MSRADGRVEFQCERARGDMRQTIDVTLTANELTCAEQLARFFPLAQRLRIPVRVTSLRCGRSRLSEATVLEYGGKDHAIFLSTLPLEFDDRVRVDKESEGIPAEAVVVAVQYHEGQKAVAVRFSHGPCDWVAQP